MQVVFCAVSHGTGVAFEPGATQHGDVIAFETDNFHSETIIFFVKLGNIKVVGDDHSRSCLQMLDE